MNAETKLLSCATPESDEKSSGQSLPRHSDSAISGQTTSHTREILVPLDLSERSNVALKYAIRLAERIGARITLLHAIDPPIVTTDSGAWYPGTDSVEQLALACVQAVSRICEEEKLRPPVLGQTIVRAGATCEIIIETAEEQKSDLLILTTHGRTGLAHVLLGSTAEEVVRRTPCPVLVVPAR